MDPSGTSLLVVEDDELQREAIAELLGTHGLNVATAANGLEALTYLRAHPLTEVILLDMAMPVMDGWRFLDEKMRDPLIRPIKVVVLSAYDFPAPQLFSKLVAAFLKKPFDISHLLATIESINAASRNGNGGNGALN